MQPNHRRPYILLPYRSLLFLRGPCAGGFLLSRLSACALGRVRGGRPPRQPRGPISTTLHTPTLQELTFSPRALCRGLSSIAAIGVRSWTGTGRATATAAAVAAARWG